MKKTILIIILLLIAFVSTPIHAQDTNNNINTYKNNITFNITRLLLLEARFGYERYISQRHILRSTIGIQFPISAESFKVINAIPFTVPFYYTVSKGIYIGLGYNYFIKPSKQIYISSELYFNYSYYDKKNYRYCVGQTKESYVTNQSMDLIKTGIKFLIGRKLRLIPSKETRIQFDIFAGIGVQYREESIMTYKKATSTCKPDDPIYIFYELDPPEENISNAWYPTLHSGILISFPY